MSFYSIFIETLSPFILMFSLIYLIYFLFQNKLDFYIDHKLSYFKLCYFIVLAVLNLINFSMLTIAYLCYYGIIIVASFFNYIITISYTLYSCVILFFYLLINIIYNYLNGNVILVSSLFIIYSLFLISLNTFALSSNFVVDTLLFFLNQSFYNYNLISLFWCFQPTNFFALNELNGILQNKLTLKTNKTRGTRGSKRSVPPWHGAEADATSGRGGNRGRGGRRGGGRRR